MFEQAHFGQGIYLEWQGRDNRYHAHRLNVKRMTRKQFKTVVRMVINSGKWYRDYSIDAYGEETAYATTKPGVHSIELSDRDVVRWLYWLKSAQ